MNPRKRLVPQTGELGSQEYVRRSGHGIIEDGVKGPHVGGTLGSWANALFLRVHLVAPQEGQA
eukprot:scaffold966_cov415-Prasinococcus_capsulatus_cf.AAC.5